jgi:putative nucleotidyltransferase with HDIG domain
MTPQALSAKTYGNRHRRPVGGGWLPFLTVLKRIPVDDLRAGMFLHELCGSWMEHPFWRTQFLLEDPADLASLHASNIREVWIDTARGLDVSSGETTVQTREQVDLQIDAALAQAADARAPTLGGEMHAEIDRARRLVRDARPAVISMFNEARLGKAVDMEGATALVNRIRGAMTRSPAAMLSVARLKRADEYTFMHSVAVSGLMIALAQQLRLSDDEVVTAGQAGLLHDLGKAKIPDTILNKPAKLTDDELDVMRKHPQIGYEMLADAGNVSDGVLDVVLHHHERIDGRGYPNNLPNERISKLAKMGAICDVYDAITSARAYKPGWDPAEAVRRMAEWSSSHFDPGLFQAFVKTVGIYPVGSLVKMESGRLGVVVDQRDGSLLKPKVKVFYSTRSQLASRPRCSICPSPARRTTLSDARTRPWKFPDLDQLWQSG